MDANNGESSLSDRLPAVSQEAQDQVSACSTRGGLRSDAQEESCLVGSEAGDGS